MKPFASGESWALYAGDCLAVLRELPAGSVDAIVTDPPYSSGGMVRGDRASATAAVKYTSTNSSIRNAPSFSGDNRDQRGYLAWSALWLGACRELVPDRAPVAVFSDWRQLPTTTDAIQAGGWVWRGIVPWYKPTSRPQIGQFRSACEYVVWGSAGPAPMDPEVGCLPGLVEGTAPRGKRRVHLTQKPLPVMRTIVRICRPGGVVLDPFAGSATTGVAALLEGRRFVGIETSTAYLELAAERLREAEREREAA